MPCHIHHVDFTVCNIARSRAFYEPLLTLLGYECRPEPNGSVLFSPANGQVGSFITIHAAKSDDSIKKHDRYSPGLHHLAFSAESRAEVDAAYNLLNRLGANVTDPPAVYYQPTYYAVFFRDPDGIKLELVHNPSP